MNRRTKNMHPASLILTLAMMFSMILGFRAPVYAAEGTDGTEMQVMEAEQLEIQLGADWAGVEFQLKTDAGLYPGTIVVGEDGVLRMEIGGSQSYILTCMNSGMSVPEAAQASATEEEQPEAQTGMEQAVPETVAAADQGDSMQPASPEAGQDAVSELEQNPEENLEQGFEQDPDAPDLELAGEDVAEMEELEPEETEGLEEEEHTVAGIPMKHILVFAVGMVLSVSVLIVLCVLKRRREDWEYEDDEFLDDEDAEDDYEEDEEDEFD